MNTKIKLPVIILFAMLFVQINIAQNKWLEILKTDNTQIKVDLDNLNKLTFSATDLILNYSAGENESVSRSDIKKMVFGTSTGVQNVTVKSNFQVFPNPANDFIQLRNIPEGDYMVSIYSITGAQIFTVKTISISNLIDISSLKRGMYIIKANNFVTKFTKE